MIGFRQNVKYPKIIIKELIPKEYFKLSTKALLLLDLDNVNIIKEILNPQSKIIDNRTKLNILSSNGVEPKFIAKTVNKNDDSIKIKSFIIVSFRMVKLYLLNYFNSNLFPS